MFSRRVAEVLLIDVFRLGEKARNDEPAAADLPPLGANGVGDAGQVANPRADRVLAGFLMETREVAWTGADRLRAFARPGVFSGRRARAMAGRVPTLRYNLSAWSFTS
jgi:hypothetical protein